MNKSSVLGIIIAIIVFFVSVLTSTNSYEVFLDFHGILSVVGGTFAASLICFPMKSLANSFKVVYNKIINQDAKPHEIVIAEIVSLAKGFRENSNYLKSNFDSIKVPFLKEAIEMTNQGGIAPEKIDQILKKRAATHYKRYEEESLIFKTMGKFPPAFGLMGTTLGMIALLQNMGGPDAIKSLGPAMAIGLVATLYGIAITNLILVPMGENLNKANKEDQIMRAMVIDGIKLLREKEHPLVVEEHLKSYLLPNERSRIRMTA